MMTLVGALDIADCSEEFPFSPEAQEALDRLYLAEIRLQADIRSLEEVENCRDAMYLLISMKMKVDRKIASLRAAMIKAGSAR